MEEVVLGRHSFNSDWLACNFAVSTDRRVLELENSKLISIAKNFDLVELRLSEPSFSWRINSDSPFEYVESQVRYAIPARRGTQLLESFKPATRTSPIDIDVFSDTRLRPFSNERYQHLRGMSEHLLNARYVSWATQIIEDEDAVCGQVEVENDLAGFFFGKLRGSVAEFTLAMSAAAANFPATVLYAAALDHFHSLGARRVESSFSSRNIGAINVHAQLGCHFTSITDIFIADLRNMDRKGWSR